ncbi:MAG: GNAT family N-acetyltransferase [Bacteroidota bacterium]
MNTSMQKLEGPRLIRRDEILESARLFNLCFGDPAIPNEEEILSDYATPRRGGTYAFLHAGRPVSQIMLFHDQIRMLDGTIRAGSIGGVCTHPDFRNQGLTTRLLEHCARQLRQEGATLMLISGARGVYTRLGNVFHGKFVYFTIRVERNQAISSGDLAIRRAAPADALVCSNLYHAEPVHFLRRKSDFTSVLENPQSNTYLHSDPWIVERAGEAVAYLFLGIPYDQPESAGIRHVSEFTGSRAALAEAIPLIVAAGNLQEVQWPVAWQDVELIRLLRERYENSFAALDGHTLRIINFPNFMKDLRPILRARLDTKLLRGLRFEQRGPLLGGTGADRYAIVRRKDRLELDGAALTCLVMGNADPQAEEIHANGALEEVLRALFPLPSFPPGLNYH